MIFSLLFLDILQLFYSLHYTSFPFLKGCRLEKGHIVPVLYSHSYKKKKKIEIIKVTCLYLLFFLLKASHTDKTVSDIIQLYWDSNLYLKMVADFKENTD